MSVKFFCDGCDKTLERTALYYADLSLSYDMPVQSHAVSSDRYTYKGELCLSCFNHLKEVSDPKKWPRAQQATKS